MKSFFRALPLLGVGCMISNSAMAVIKPAPGPEIGDGLVGVAVAAVVLLAFVMLPRLKRFRNREKIETLAPDITRRHC